jgi:hypothetical protein
MAGAREEFFPAGIAIGEVRAAIAGRSDLYEARKDGLSIFNYHRCVYPRAGDNPDVSTFPDPAGAPDGATRRRWQLRRECRGLIFDGASGALLARRFHKFFNVGELPETAPDEVDAKLRAASSHTVLAKLDGSMVTPITLGGQLRWCFKLGLNQQLTPGVEAFVAAAERQGVPYGAACTGLEQEGWTALFEWCTPAQIIKVVPERESLTLLALRHRYSGRYMPPAAMAALAVRHGLPAVAPLHLPPGPALTAAALVAHIRGMPAIEGGVLRLDGPGEMFKIKTWWYVGEHGALGFSSERVIWARVLRGEHDDWAAGLPAEEAAALLEFAAAMSDELDATVGRLLERRSRVASAPLGTAESAVLNALPAGTTAGAVRAAAEAELLRRAEMKRKKENWAARLDTARPLIGGIRFERADGCWRTTRPAAGEPTPEPAPAPPGRGKQPWPPSELAALRERV